MEHDGPFVVVKMLDSVPSTSYSSVCKYCVNGASRSSLLVDSDNKNSIDNKRW